VGDRVEEGQSTERVWGINDPHRLLKKRSSTLVVHWLLTLNNFLISKRVFK